MALSAIRDAIPAADAPVPAGGLQASTGGLPARRKRVLPQRTLRAAVFLLATLAPCAETALAAPHGDAPSFAPRLLAQYPVAGVLLALAFAVFLAILFLIARAAVARVAARTRGRTDRPPDPQAPPPPTAPDADEWLALMADVATAPATVSAERLRKVLFAPALHDPRQPPAADLSDHAAEVLFRRMTSLAKAIEARNPWARGHSQHVMRYALGIARVLGLEPPEVDVIRRAAIVHDLGEIGVPHTVLTQPRALTPDERRLVQQHTLIGVHLLGQARALDREVPLVRHHHERWDGTGYPDGIRGPTIPPGARVLAVADTFDAVTSTRAYRPPRSIAEAVHILRDESGRQFDPDVVDAMITWVETVGHRTGKAGRLEPRDFLEADPDTPRTRHP